MQVASYIFLKRKWQKDQPHLINMIEYLVALKYTGQILLFPEGKIMRDGHQTKLNGELLFHSSTVGCLSDAEGEKEDAVFNGLIQGLN